MKPPKSVKRIDIITCPNCGAEYTAGEIYIPKAFLGQPESLDRECITHKILSDLGKPMNPTESYTCDFCNTTFTVTAFIKFQTRIDDKHNFNTDYTTKIQKKSLFNEGNE